MQAFAWEYTANVAFNIRPLVFEIAKLNHITRCFLTDFISRFVFSDPENPRKKVSTSYDQLSIFYSDSKTELLLLSVCDQKLHFCYTD
jgi:hypothetical protein